jgi:hypothetical protein
VPTLLMVPLMVRRTLVEERMLARALPGYADYMRRVRSRIVPACGEFRMKVPPCLIFTLSDRSPS